MCVKLEKRIETRVSTYSNTVFDVPYKYEMEQTSENWQAGGTVVGNRRIWSLSYADDIILLARKIKDMKEMITKLEIYLNGSRHRKKCIQIRELMMD